MRRSPTRSREFDRIFSCGRSVCVTRTGFFGFVTSSAVTFFGCDSWATQSTRRPSRVFWRARPSPQLPKPLSGWWPSSRMFRELLASLVVFMGPDVDKLWGPRLESGNPPPEALDDGAAGGGCNEGHAPAGRAHNRGRAPRCRPAAGTRATEAAHDPSRRPLVHHGC